METAQAKNTKSVQGSPNSVYKKIQQIYQQINERGFEATGKVSYGKTNYEYVEDTELLKRMRKLFADVGLVIVQTDAKEVGYQGDLCRVETTYQIVDVETGDCVFGSGYGHGKDGQDKGGNKAITAALKFFFSKTFLIPMGGDPDAYEPSQKSSNNNRSRQPQQHREPAPQPPRGQQQPQQSQPQQSNKGGYRSATMPAGKHEGKTLEQVAQEDFDYLKWVSQTWGQGDRADDNDRKLQKYAQKMVQELQSDLEEIQY